jgi:hypothetical protein
MKNDEKGSRYDKKKPKWKKTHGERPFVIFFREIYKNAKNDGK